MYKILFVAILVLTGCSNNYRGADYKVLCDPKTKEAYYVEPGIGHTSFLRKNSNLNDVCK